MQIRAPSRCQTRGLAFIINAKLPCTHPSANATAPAMQMMYKQSCSASFCPWKSMSVTIVPSDESYI